MSKKLFLKKCITKYRETGAILPSSKFLAKKMITKEDIEKSEVIVELWAGSGSFTEYIFKYFEEYKLNNKNTSKKIFIIEKDIDFYNVLLKKFPEYSNIIYNIDLLDIEDLMINNDVKNIDLIISWLPFKSLPKEIFDFLVLEFLPKFINNTTKFIQFSYFSNFMNILSKYFKNIDKKRCLLNIPTAYIFTCSNFIKDESEWNK